jgi:hypothetical protein
VKSGGAVEPLGTRITLHITDPSDMTRDLLKVTTWSGKWLSSYSSLGEIVFVK